MAVRDLITATKMTSQIKILHLHYSKKQESQLLYQTVLYLPKMNWSVLKGGISRDT